MRRTAVADAHAHIGRHPSATGISIRRTQRAADACDYPVMFNHATATEVVIHEPHAGRYALHVHRNAEVWTWASAIAIAAELRRELMRRPRARMLVAGGDTPASVYRALSKAPLQWDRVDVALVDERWLQPDDPDSNAWLVRTHLLQHHAAQARFEPMTQPGRRIEEAVAIASAHGLQPASVAVLGMGSDGHLASLFPRMRDLDRALDSRQPYVAVDASGCVGAQQWSRRISLTPTGLRHSRSRVLLIRGREKLDAFEYALASGDVESWPVLLALGDSFEVPLQIHWCA
ncbi:6-phosphogluconolactonase [Lysobacter koreensis]|uniref:6-phosphogluconolactonase n=1 Tax=Lysobacter koreensis TaxID=266122 RepID=A0ABW2YIG8_9GAMM